MAEPTDPRTETHTRDFENFMAALKTFLETTSTVAREVGFRTFWCAAKASAHHDWTSAATQHGLWLPDEMEKECEKRNKEQWKKHGIESLKRGLEAGADKERKRWEAAGHVLDSLSPCTAGHIVEEHIATPIVPARTFADAVVVTELAFIRPEPPFNWADYAFERTPPAPPAKPPRDYSILSSSVPRPFGSLQRRTKRSHTRYPPPQSFNNRHQCHSSTFTSHRQRQYHLQIPETSLDWQADPRLSDLSIALEHLGWVRREAC